MRKAKLFTVVILVIVTLSMTVLQVGASRIIVPINETIAIDYSHCANIPTERAAQIVNSMFGINAKATEMIQPSSIWCIFGHSISTGVIITINHRAYSTVPRCRETVNSVEFCNRCSYFAVLSERTTRIGCC